MMEYWVRNPDKLLEIRERVLARASEGVPPRRDRNDRNRTFYENIRARWGVFPTFHYSIFYPCVLCGESSYEPF
jgi:hypothetical protein